MPMWGGVETRGKPRKQLVSIAQMAGVDPNRICDAATWASSSTFAKYYRLNLMAEALWTLAEEY